MRARDIFAEAIVNQPRDRVAFLTNRIKLLKAISEATTAAVATIKACDRSGEGEYLLRYALGVANGGDRPMLPSDYSVDLNRHYEIETLIHNLDSIVRHGVKQFARFVSSTISYMKPLDEETRAVLALASHVEPGFVAYGYDADAEEDDEIREARKWAGAYAVIGQALPKLEATIAGIKAMFDDLAKRDEYFMNPHKYRPDHGEVERLYHASLYAAALVTDGFSAEKPIERKGLGNYGDQATISFTHDYKIALDIARAFRELWLIVHGQLTRRKIVEWIHNEGIDLKHASVFMNSEPPDSVAQTIRLYRGYLAYAKNRSDPKFVSPEDLIPLMQDLDYKSIGIISAEVTLTPAKGNEDYLHGEKEFRVRASAVKPGSIKRVI